MVRARALQGTHDKDVNEHELRGNDRQNPRRQVDLDNKDDVVPRLRLLLQRRIERERESQRTATAT